MQDSHIIIFYENIPNRLKIEIEFNGIINVIYSKYDLEEGWSGNQSPYCKGYDERSSLNIGLNAVIYASTH